MNYLMSKSLKWHVLGTMWKPTTLQEQDGNYYKQGSLAPLSDDDVEKHKVEMEAHEQKQALVQEVIYRTIDKSTFLQIKNKVDTEAIWKKLVSIHANKGNLYETNLLTQLQNACYTEGGNMWEHLTKMVEIKEHLAEMCWENIKIKFFIFLYLFLPKRAQMWLQTLSDRPWE